MPLARKRPDVARPWLLTAPIVFGRVEMSPLFSWGAGGDLRCCDPWWLLALLHCLGTMSNSLLSPTGDGGHSFIVLVGLGGMLRLEQIWA